MRREIFGWPGKLADRTVEGVVVGANLTRQVATWFVNINRLRILPFTERRYPDYFKTMDGGDKRLMRAFLDPESISNTVSLLGGMQAPRGQSEFGISPRAIMHLLQDALGTEAAFDNSFIERNDGAQTGAERWFFINGIVTSRELAVRNVDALRRLFDRPFTLIHNPTQGFTNDLVESALQKFSNINTEPAARAFLAIAEALLNDTVENVVVVAHSQGTIVMGDALDLLYCSIDRKYFDRTNMNDEDLEVFMNYSSGTVKSAELKEMAERLEARGPGVLAKLELYMFANAASRMCYIDEKQKYPHIESFANEHDIVTRLGSLARDDFHNEDLIRIDGSLFTCDRYGHLLNAHYLPDFERKNYTLSKPNKEPCIGMSVHDPVLGNPCTKHPKHISGPAESKLFARYEAAQAGRPEAQRLRGPAQAPTRGTKRRRTASRTPVAAR
jgi:hypothetical protein